MTTKPDSINKVLTLSAADVDAMLSSARSYPEVDGGYVSADEQYVIRQQDGRSQAELAEQTAIATRELAAIRSLGMNVISFGYVVMPGSDSRLFTVTPRVEPLIACPDGMYKSAVLPVLRTYFGTKTASRKRPDFGYLDDIVGASQYSNVEGTPVLHDVHPSVNDDVDYLRELCGEVGLDRRPESRL